MKENPITESPPPNRPLPQTPTPEERYEITRDGSPLSESSQKADSPASVKKDDLPNARLPHLAQLPTFYEGKVNGVDTYFRMLSITNSEPRYHQVYPWPGFYNNYDAAHLEGFGFKAIEPGNAKRIKAVEDLIASRQEELKEQTNLVPKIFAYKAPGDSKVHPFYETIEKLAEIIDRVELDEKYSKSHKDFLKNQFERLTHLIRKPLFDEAKFISERIGTSLGIIDANGKLSKQAFDNKSRGINYRSQISSYKKAVAITKLLRSSMIVDSKVNPVENAIIDDKFQNYIVELYEKVQDRCEKLISEKLALGIDKNDSKKIKDKKGVIDNESFPFEENLLKIIACGLTNSEKGEIIVKQQKKAGSYYLWPSRLEQRKFEATKNFFKDPNQESVSDDKLPNLGSGRLEEEDLGDVTVAVEGDQKNLNNSRTADVKENKSSCFSVFAKCVPGPSKDIKEAHPDQGGEEKKSSTDPTGPDDGKKGSQSPKVVKPAEQQNPLVFGVDDDPGEVVSRASRNEEQRTTPLETSPLGGASNEGQVSRTPSVESEYRSQEGDVAAKSEGGGRGRKRGSPAQTPMSDEQLNEIAVKKAAQEQEGIYISSDSPRGRPKSEGVAQTPVESPPPEVPASSTAIRSVEMTSEQVQEAGSALF